MKLKMIIDDKDKKFYIDTEKIEAIKCIKIDYYFLMYIFLPNQKIELKFENEEDLNNAINGLKG